MLFNYAYCAQLSYNFVDIMLQCLHILYKRAIFDCKCFQDNFCLVTPMPMATSFKQASIEKHPVKNVFM